MTFPKGTKLVIVRAADKTIDGFVEGAVVYSQGGTQGFTVVTAEKDSDKYITSQFIGGFNYAGWDDTRFKVMAEDAQ